MRAGGQKEKSMIKTIAAISSIAAAMLVWLLLLPGHEQDPKEDEEQARYLEEWRKSRSGKGENR